MKRYALTAIGRDRPGIVAAVTGAIFEHGCNIEDSSMTILEDEFAIILIMSATEDADIAALEAAMKGAEEAFALTIHLKEIGPREDVARPANHILTLHGADTTGLVSRTAAVLSKSGLNITNLETKMTGMDEKAYIMVMEVYSPEDVDVESVRGELAELAESLGVTIRLKPLEAYEPL